MQTQSGQGSAIAPPRTVQSQAYLIATIVLGITGSLVAIAAFGKGSYRVGPMLVELRAKPAFSGTTDLGVAPPPGIGLKPGFVHASTHSGFVALRGTVVGVIGLANAPEAARQAADPLTLAKSIRDQGKTAFRKFGLKVGLLALAGGASGGFAIALVGLKVRRVFQGAMAGVLVSVLIAFLAWQTYDINKFSQAQFRLAGVIQPLGP